SGGKSRGGALPVRRHWFRLRRAGKYAGKGLSWAMERTLKLQTYPDKEPGFAEVCGLWKLMLGMALMVGLAITSARGAPSAVS
ncbi:MAG: hypothetical protein QHJ82_05570, partial [Verrucomicrobiota bacterium]|nr:hypothetical protein [Verrucomicrobiota bacterium]